MHTLRCLCDIDPAFVCRSGHLAGLISQLSESIMIHISLSKVEASRFRSLCPYHVSILHRHFTGAGMISSKFLMGRGRERLSPKVQSLLEDGISDVQQVPARRILVRRGEPVHSSIMIVEGFVSRSANDRRGQQQTVSLHVPGDFVDLDGFTLKRLDHDVVTIGPAKIAIYRHNAIARISERCAHMNAVLWLSSLLDAAIHRAWIFLTSIHTNRVLRSLRERGLLTLNKRQVVIYDLKSLSELGDFDPYYLYPSVSDIQFK